MSTQARPGRVSEPIHDRVRRDILAGRLSPGDAVPSERSLAEEFGVHRHAVREALKRLEQAGLVRISQGGATRVLDWQETGGLDVLLDLLPATEAEPPSEIKRAVLEMRASIGIDAARRCAARAPAATRAQVRSHADEAVAAVGVDDDALDASFATLWQAIVVGSENVAYRLGLNSLMAALAAHASIADEIRPTDRGAVAELGEAIDAADPERAAAAARRLLEEDLSLAP